jgi:hypothetical protein|tara:strand:+ start:460 stop:960 length:501 start_codon:yes stop_codon:yes gene_type:complete
MKLNRLETHDRLQHFVKDQAVNIFQGAEDCLKRNPDSLAIQDKSPYVYIFAHPRTADDGVNKRMLWQPRLSIPEAQTNSYLFRAISHTDTIQIVWLIPPKEQWKQYEKGNVTEQNEVAWSIEMFKHKKKELEKPHPDDMTEEYGRLILKAIVDEKLQEVRRPKVYV